MAQKREFRFGDRVRVPSAFEDMTGTVVEVYGSEGARTVVVDVELHGASGEVLTTRRTPYDAAEVTLVEPAQAS